MWRHLLVGGASLALFAGGLFANLLKAAEPSRPNFIVLLADDLRADCLGFSGHPLVKTPHIDRLASEGVTFKNAFVTTAICCISRASFITGRYARHHHVADFDTALSPELLTDTYPAVLHRAGYHTGCFGKWGLGGKSPEGVFDVWDAWGGQGEFFHVVDGERIHNSEFLTRKTAEFLRGRPANQPFCLLVYYKSPHDPYQPDPRDADLFSADVIEPPATYTDRHFAAMPEFIRKSEGRTRAMNAHGTPEKYQEFVKQYLRCIAGVDRSAGQIKALLDELKLTDNTVIVVSSDNGFFLGEHGLSHKWLMHEESIRIPLVIRDPRLPERLRGRRLDNIVLNIDLAPTLVDLAGAEIPKGTDGRSLKPLLAGENVPWRSDFFYEHHFHYGGKIPRTEGVRTSRWKYITYYDVEPAFEELYDLAADPHEEHNLAGDAAHREQLEILRKRYREYLMQFGPPVLPKR
ncbi:MAG TPA: sulfatase [Planctomycetaceae bacterium]|nr:sulfatase [Planctomycetaceae bacterium]